jgi:hypothetical protein
MNEQKHVSWLRVSGMPLAEPGEGHIENKSETLDSQINF